MSRSAAGGPGGERPEQGGRGGCAEAPPLAGVRVLDLTQVVAGPFCTMMLADLGADVVKLERPGTGDEMRSIGRRAEGDRRELFFVPINRSKRSIALDLKDAKDQAVAHELARRADVVVENFAPGTADRLGMGWTDLSRLNPGLLYCSLSGFGQSGPYRDRLAVDPIIQAVSGVMSVTGFADGEPVQVGAPIGDAVAGMFAAYAIVGHLHAVRRGGRGRYIDVSMQAAMLAVLGPRLGEALNEGVAPNRVGNENPIRVPANTYRTGDGGHLTISASNDGHWRGLCRALGREEWLADERLASMPGRIAHRAEMNERLATRFAERPSHEWIPRLEAERVPFAVVNDYVEALADSQVVHRRLVRTLDHPRRGAVRVVGPPWLVSGSKSETPMRPPPLVGEHTAEVLADWLGWEGAAIARFESERTRRQGTG